MTLEKYTGNHKLKSRVPLPEFGVRGTITQIVPTDFVDFQISSITLLPLQCSKTYYLSASCDSNKSNLDQNYYLHYCRSSKFTIITSGAGSYKNTAHNSSKDAN